MYHRYEARVDEQDDRVWIRVRSHAKDTSDEGRAVLSIAAVGSDDSFRWELSPAPGDQVAGAREPSRR